MTCGLLGRRYGWKTRWWWSIRWSVHRRSIYRTRIHWWSIYRTRIYRTRIHRTSIHRTSIHRRIVIDRRSIGSSIHRWSIRSTVGSSVSRSDAVAVTVAFEVIIT